MGPAGVALVGVTVGERPGARQATGAEWHSPGTGREEGAGGEVLGGSV